jgi:hypothetical protein
MALAPEAEQSALRSTLDHIITTHGVWPVLRALAARLFRRAPLKPLGLNDHLRRDLGLGPLPPWGDPTP